MFWMDIFPSSLGSKSKRSFLSASASFLLGLLFDPEDGGDMFLRNVKLSPNSVVLLPRTLDYTPTVC
jgi:hypothetical protein